MKQLPNTRWIALGEALSWLEDRGIQESAIFEAARDERGEMRGAKQRGGNPEHPIAAKYFNTPRRACGSGRDTLEIGNEVDQDTFLTARRDGSEHPVWYSVQVLRKGLVTLGTYEGVGNGIDPFAEASWNLDQALIWFAGRSAAAVADASDAAGGIGKRRLTWFLYAGSYYDHDAVQREFLSHLERGTISVRTETNEFVEPSWFQHAAVHITGEPFAASLQRIDLDGERHETTGGGAIVRRHVRSFNARFDPRQLRTLWPVPPEQKPFAETPYDNPEEPLISFADAVRWRMCDLINESGRAEANEHDNAQKEIERLCRNQTLCLWGYHRSQPDELVAIPWPKMGKLKFSVVGGQPETELENERGSRPYGHAWTERGPIDEWTGLCLKKTEIIEAFTRGAAKPATAHYVETGAPGRPSASHLILAEFERRAKVGDAHQSVAAEARHLEPTLMVCGQRTSASPLSRLVGLRMSFGKIIADGR